MNVFAPISSIMTTKIYTVSTEDNLATVKEIFDAHRIHHIPVLHVRQLKGIISLRDFQHFLGGMNYFKEGEALSQQHLENTKASEIMTAKLAKVEPDDRINVALEVFSENLFHALPVVDEGELVGIVTPFDIMKALLEEKPAHPEDVYCQI
jgi:acetoin utilization protein AcuB